MKPNNFLTKSVRLFAGLPEGFVPERLAAKKGRKAEALPQPLALGQKTWLVTPHKQR